MVLRLATVALSLASISFLTSSVAFASDNQLLALNAPVRSASDPAMQQAVEILAKSPRLKAGQTKRGTLFNSQPANDTTVVKQRKDLDKVLILGGAEVLPM